MAIYHLSVKPISRATKRSAVASAAYRAGEKIMDERTGETHDYSRKRGIVHSALILPGGGADDRASYWNRIEKHHKRGDAVLSREVEIAIPAELTEGQRQELATKFSRELANKYGVAADLNIHKPHRAKADTRNHHAHIMLSACYTQPDGTLGKKAVELDPIHCQRNKLENMADWTRKRWESLANEALREAVSKSQIDRRTLKAQRISAIFFSENATFITDDPAFEAEKIKLAAELDRPATIHLGPAATALERRGTKTDRGNYNRDIIDLVAAKADRQELEDHLGKVTEEIGFVTKEIEIEDAKAELDRERAAAAAKKKVQPLDVVVVTEPPKSTSTELIKTEIEKKQDVESFPDTTRLTDLRPSLGNVPTPISSELVFAPESLPAQSEALPAGKESNQPIQQPAVDEALNAVLRRIAKISQYFQWLYELWAEGKKSDQAYNEQAEKHERELKEITKPFPNIEISPLQYDDTPIIVNGEPITDIVRRLPPEPIQVPDVKPSQEPKSTQSRKR
jgi:hypothetical protein